MKNKLETKTYLIQFFNCVYSQFNLRVKILRTNNRFEFINDDIRSHYFNHAIKHQTSCTYIPQQNGVVKCKHRHLLDVSYALHFQISLPISLWGECLLTATYLINHMSLSVLKDKTLYEILLKRRSTYDLLRSFGCLCYEHMNDKSQDKFASRAKPCVFVGYPNGQKRI